METVKCTATQMSRRRNFLRGAGVALALPWMESLPLLAADAASPAAKAAANKPPVRFATLYFSNGVEPIHWWAKGSGASMEIGPGLAPMMPYPRGHHTSFAACITSRPSFPRVLTWGGCPTCCRAPRSVSTPTTSVWARPSIRCWRSQIGGQTAVPSLVLGIEPNELRLEDGVSMIYGSCISWATPTRPATKEIYPARAFDLLVGDGSGRKLDRSILDAVLQETHDLQPKISRSDRHKLDEYLTSIRDIENRIDRAGKEERLEGWRPTLAKPNMPRPGERASAERAGSHEVDAGSDRARVPDGQDAHRDLHAQQRSVADELPVRRRRSGSAASRSDAQRQSSGGGGDVPEDQPIPRAAVRVSDTSA